MTGSEDAGSRTAGTADASEAGGPLRIVITSPFVWPWVRRGSERTLHDLSTYLTERDHHVTVFSTGPEDSVENRGDIQYHLMRQRFGLRPRQFNSLHEFAYRLQRSLARCEADVVFCMHYFDAYAAIRARQRTRARYKVIYHSVGLLSRRHFRAVPLDAWFFRTVRRHADATVTVSRYAEDLYRREFGVEATTIAPPVVIEQYLEQVYVASAGGPRILFVSDANDRRKGALVLCRAFGHVARKHPAARLVFAGHASEETRAGLESECRAAGIADRVDFLGVGRLEDLPGLYGQADVTVLPAVEEAFGMVLVESMAAGTPVVAASQGGPPEIVDGPLVGRLFDPGESRREPTNAEGLASAILEVLATGKTPQVVAACRASARRFSLETLGPVYESLFRRLAPGRTST